ncbi:MAG: hypothetical protein WC897_05475 [Candidatus Gracilibacteria bacterium]
MPGDDQNPKVDDGIEKLSELKKKEDEEASLPAPSEESLKVLNEFNVGEVLEVEEMPESNELQERRKKTKNRLKELAEVDSTPQEDASFEEEGGIMDILKEANLSGRHVKFCCGGVLALALILAIIFGGFKGLSYLKNRTVVPDPGEASDSGNSDGYDVTDSSIWVAVLVGEKELAPDGATSSGENLGEGYPGSSELARKIDDFGSIYESMQVDINELLDQSIDRTSVLDSYTKELKYLNNLGENNLFELNAQASSLVALFDEVDGEKGNAESKFFDRMKELDAYASAGALEDFIVKAEQSVRLRAEYQARKKLISYYESIIVDVGARISDIEFNREALIKGIQVVDVSGSDINLIIDESEL